MNRIKIIFAALFFVIISQSKAQTVDREVLYEDVSIKLSYTTKDVQYDLDKKNILVSYHANGKDVSEIDTYYKSFNEYLQINQNKLKNDTIIRLKDFIIDDFVIDTLTLRLLADGMKKRHKKIIATGCIFWNLKINAANKSDTLFFPHKLMIDSSVVDNFYVNLCVFKDSVKFHLNSSGYSENLMISNTKFEEYVKVDLLGNRGEEFLIMCSHFFKNAFFGNYIKTTYLNNFFYSSCKFDFSSYYRLNKQRPDTSLCDYTFFYDSLFIKDLKVSPLFKFRECEFYKFIDYKNKYVDRSTESPNQLFEDCFFEPGLVFEIPYDFKFSRIGLSIENFKNINWSFYSKAAYASFKGIQKSDIGDIDREFYEVRNFIFTTSKFNDALQQETVGWLNFQNRTFQNKVTEEKLNAALTFDNIFTWLSEEYLYHVVNYGYKGEKKFITVTLIVILFFTLVFFIGYFSVIDEYVSTDKVAKRKWILFTKVLPRKDVWEYSVSFLRCFWFSFVVLLNPRFPSRYFSFHKTLVLIISLEWIIGVVLVCTYLIHIASQYPFVKAIVGV